MTGADVVAAARGWIGTPFQHQGRAKGVGVDCAGLIVGVARELGFQVEDVEGYARQPFGGYLKQVVEAQSIAVKDAQPGDIYLMRFLSEPQHLGFASDIGIIHALQNTHKCVEHSMDKTWLRRIVAVYRFRELA